MADAGTEMEAAVPRGPSRNEQAIELGVFLFLIVPSLVLSLFISGGGSVGFVPLAIMVIFRDLALVSLVVFFLWRNRESVARIGWKFKHRWLDVVIGVLLFVPIFLGTAALDRFLESIGLSGPTKPQPAFVEVQGLGQAVLAFFLVVVVALSEETIFRGYLILRLRALTTGVAPAVILSSIIFSLGHGYEGASGVVTVGTMGAILALIYVWRRSLVAPIVIHFLQDFLSIVLLPLLAQHH